jgi:hypothetical protein
LFGDVLVDEVESVVDDYVLLCDGFLNHHAYEEQLCSTLHSLFLQHIEK